MIQYLSGKYPEMFQGKAIEVNNLGLTNIVLIIGNENQPKWIFRFPREDHPQFRRQMLLEQKVMPILKKKVTIAIPDYKLMSGQNEELLYVGYPMIEGTQLYTNYFSSLNNYQKEQLAITLAQLLTELHTMNYKKMIKSDTLAPVNEREKWKDYYKMIQKIVYPCLGDKEKKWTSTFFENFLLNSENFLFQPCLTHADFKPEHIIFDQNKGILSGVIDFRIEITDPAIDFGYLTYGKSFNDILLSHYKGIVDPTYKNRIQFYYNTRPYYGLLYGVNNNSKKAFEENLQLLHKQMVEENG